MLSVRRNFRTNEINALWWWVVEAFACSFWSTLKITIFALWFIIYKAWKAWKFIKFGIKRKILNLDSFQKKIQRTRVNISSIQNHQKLANLPYKKQIMKSSYSINQIFYKKFSKK